MIIFRAVRYEDLSMNPYEMTQDILQFYGLPFDPQVEEFLDSHTKSNYGGVSSTFRDSKSAPFHWIKDLDIDEVSIFHGCFHGSLLIANFSIDSIDSTKLRQSHGTVGIPQYVSQRLHRWLWPAAGHTILMRHEFPLKNKI